MCSGSRVELLEEPWHIWCFVLNCCLPGTGTMLSAFSCVQAPSTGKKPRVNWATFFDGLMQQYLSLVIVGWIWSVIFGFALFKKRKSAQPSLTKV